MKTTSKTIIMKSVLRVFCIGIVLLFSLAASSQALIINGDFSDGLNGWQTSQPDLVSVDAEGRATLVTDGNAFMIDLWQDFDIPVLASSLSFDVFFQRGNGSDIEGFPDFLWISYVDADDLTGDYYMDFLGYDHNGPFNSNGNLYDLSGGWYRLTADISSLQGRSGTLYFDLYDDWDGFSSTAKVDNVTIVESTVQVPEPSTLILLGSSLLVFLGMRKRRA